jgi:hypothetical protein
MSRPILARRCCTLMEDASFVSVLPSSDEFVSTSLTSDVFCDCAAVCCGVAQHAIGIAAKITKTHLKIFATGFCGIEATPWHVIYSGFHLES